MDRKCAERIDNILHSLGFLSYDIKKYRDKSVLQDWVKYRIYWFGIFIVEVLVINVLTYWICNRSGHNQLHMQEQQSVEEQIISECRYFPIPARYRNRIAFQDTYGDSRIQGGHEGCDIMDLQDIPGQIPVISVCDGTITNKGWLYLGGYRIGITSESGIYYYYAHLDSYAANIEVGDRVCAGQFLGFMGNSGEGEEGTVGNFPTHLHFGIYHFKQSKQGMNPYPYLTLLYNPKQ